MNDTPTQADSREAIIDQEADRQHITRLHYSIGRELREAKAILWLLWMAEDLPHQIPDGVMQNAAHAALGKMQDMEVNLAELGIVEAAS